MAEPQGVTPQTPTPPPPPAAQQPTQQPAGAVESRPATRQQATGGSQQQGQAGDTSRPEKPADPAQAVIKEIADKLRDAAGSVAGTDARLAQKASRLAGDASDSVKANQRGFQHELAYAVQDVEKIAGTKLPLSDQARAEVTKLAASAPGLDNDRMAALLRSTETIGDNRMVQDIRRAATDIGQQADQNTALTRDRIEVLENKARLAAPTQSAVDQSQTHRAAPESAAQRSAADRPDQPRAQDQTRRQDQGTRPNLDRPIIVETGFTGALMDGIFRAMRPPAGNGSPLEPAAQPFGSRLAAFEEKTRDDQTLRGAEKSGRAALDALEGFRNGEGEAVMNRIKEAAKTYPGGWRVCFRRCGRAASSRTSASNSTLRSRTNAARPLPTTRRPARSRAMVKTVRPSSRPSLSDQMLPACQPNSRRWTRRSARPRARYLLGATAKICSTTSVNRSPSCYSTLSKA